MKKKMRGAISWKNLPCYERDYIVDDDNIKYIEFGSIDKPVTIEITQEDVRNLLDIEVKYRELIIIKWRKKLTKEIT